MRALYAVLLVSCVLLLGCQAEDPPGTHPDGAPRTAYALRPPPAADHLAFSRGQTVYVPVYSHINVRGGSETVAMAANVVVRNTDQTHTITLTSVRYFDNDGRLLGEYLEEAEAIPALGSRTFFVAERDHEGGAGANMMVDWRANEPVSEPIVEAVMAHTVGAQGVAFTSHGRVVEEHGDEEPVQE